MISIFNVIKNVIYKTSNSALRTTVVITIFALITIITICAQWDFLSSNILPNTGLGLYRKSYWENILVEMHGVVVELVVFGILIFWLDTIRSSKKNIRQQLEDLSDYALLDFPEINTKKVGHMKRLNKAGVMDFNVQNLCLAGMTLKNVSAKDTNMIGLKVPRGRVQYSFFSNVKMRSSNFEDCKISTTQFDSSDLTKANFTGASCKGVSFRECVLERANFTNCNLKNANLGGADLREAKFEGANLSHCNILNAENIDVHELGKAECLHYIKTTGEIVQQLASLRGDMKYQKDTRRT